MSSSAVFYPNLGVQAARRHAVRLALLKELRRIRGSVPARCESFLLSATEEHVMGLVLEGRVDERLDRDVFLDEAKRILISPAYADTFTIPNPTKVKYVSPHHIAFGVLDRNLGSVDIAPGSSVVDGTRVGDEAEEKFRGTRGPSANRDEHREASTTAVGCTVMLIIWCDIGRHRADQLPLQTYEKLEDAEATVTDRLTCLVHKLGAKFVAKMDDGRLDQLRDILQDDLNKVLGHDPAHDSGYLAYWQVAQEVFSSVPQFTFSTTSMPMCRACGTVQEVPSTFRGQSGDLDVRTLSVLSFEHPHARALPHPPDDCDLQTKVQAVLDGFGPYDATARCRNEGCDGTIAHRNLVLDGLPHRLALGGGFEIPSSKVAAFLSHHLKYDKAESSMHLTYKYVRDAATDGRGWLTGKAPARPEDDASVVSDGILNVSLQCRLIAFVLKNSSTFRACMYAPVQAECLAGARGDHGWIMYNPHNPSQHRVYPVNPTHLASDVRGGDICFMVFQRVSGDVINE